MPATETEKKSCSTSKKSGGCGCGHHHEEESHGGSCACGGHHHESSGSSCGCGHNHSHEQQATAGDIAKAEAASASSSGAGHTCKCQNLRPYRRLHSVLGVVVGLFIVAHLSVLATALTPAKFTQNSQALHVLSSNLPLVEIVAVLIPSAALLAVGGYLLFKSGLKYNVKKCNRGGKLRYFLQRVSALVLLIFMLVHVAVFSQWGLSRLKAPSDAATPVTYESVVQKVAASLGGAGTSALAILSTGLYLLAILAVAYHFANGLWTGAIIWDLCKSDLAKRRWGYCCLAIGIGISAIGLVAWYAFTIVPHVAA